MSIQSRVCAADYRALEALNISRLKELSRSPQHYQYALTHPKVTKPLSLGTAAHCATLEPRRFLEEFTAWTRRSEKSGNLCPRTGQYWEDFCEENEGKTIITEDEYTVSRLMATAVRNDPVALPYLQSGDPEVVMQWTNPRTGRECKGRVDWLSLRIDNDYSQPSIVGLKTTRDARPFQFGAQAAKLGYHLQWAWYHDGFQTLRNISPRMIEIVVESAPPHAVVVYEIPDDVLLQGREEYEKLLDTLAVCEAKAAWPGPFAEVQTLTLPTWAYPGDDLAELGLET